MDISRDKEIYVFSRLLDASEGGQDQTGTTLLEHWRISGKLKWISLFLFGEDSETNRFPKSFYSSGALPYIVALENLLETFAERYDMAARNIMANEPTEKVKLAGKDKTDANFLVTYLKGFSAVNENAPSVDVLLKNVADALSPCVPLLNKVQHVSPASVLTNIATFEEFLIHRTTIDYRKKYTNGKRYFTEAQ